MLKIELQAPVENNNDLSSILEGSKASLLDEIKVVEREVAAWGGDKPAVITSGTLEDYDGDIYYFKVKVVNPVYPPEYTALEITVERGKRSVRLRGHVLSVEDSGNTLNIALDDNVTSPLMGSEISFDATYILKKNLDKLENGLENLETIRRTLGLAPAIISDIDVTHESVRRRKLNKDQIQAISRTGGSQVGLIFGPPGTGKTSTLGSLVAQLAEKEGKRVLVTAHTNTALDTALAAVVDAIPAKWINDGKIIREGNLSKEYRHLGISARDVAGRQGKAIFDLVSKELISLERRAEPYIAQPTFGNTLKRSKKKSKGGTATPQGRVRQLLSSLSSVNIPFGSENEVEEIITRTKEILAVMSDATKKAVKDTQIVGATLSQIAVAAQSALGYFDAVIIDEGSMASLPQVMIAASLSRNQVIVLGDPKQLPPVVQSQSKIAKAYLKKNLFQHLRLEDPGIDDPRRPILTIQYRMPPSVCALVSGLFYANRLSNAEGVDIRAKDVVHNLVLLDTTALGFSSERKGKSRINEGHAELIAQIVNHLHEEEEYEISVISPFAAQGNIIRDAIMENTRTFFRAGGQIGTIHRSQGGEKDTIILDTVDSGSVSNMSSFLDASWNEDLPNLLCVGLSRARKRLIILANTRSFRQKYGKKDSLIMKILEQSYKVGEYIPLEHKNIGDSIVRVTGGMKMPKLIL